MPSLSEPKMITKTAVAERAGWSLSLVKRFLGEPDETKKVRFLQRPLALYALARVEAVEGSEEFKSAQHMLAARKEAGKKAVETKKADLLESIASMEISVARFDMARVREAAIKSYNLTHAESRCHENSDPAFLDRITVNFIRHELTRYDESLFEIAGKTGVKDAFLAISRKIFEAITEAYPELEDECTEQLSRRE